MVKRVKKRGIKVNTKIEKRLEKVEKIEKINIIIIAGVILVLVVFGFYLFKLTGHTIIDISSGIQDKYNLGDKFNGTITITLVKGDVIQKDTMIGVKLLKNNNVVASRNLSFEEYLQGQLTPVKITGNAVDSYFNQTGSYTRNIDELIGYDFSEPGNYALKIEVPILSVSSSKDFVVEDERTPYAPLRRLGFQSTSGNIDACQIIDTPGTYIMTRNLVDSDVSSTGCFYISVSNVVLDCNGYFIRNTALTVPGILVGDSNIWDGDVNRVKNVTIRNCNVTMSKTYGSYGIRFTWVNDSFIINNIVNSNYDGIYLSLSNNNTLIGNIANSNSHSGISLGENILASSNNILTGNTANSNYYGIIISSGSNNILTGNTANSNSYSGILINSNNNTLTGNTLNSNSQGGGVIFASSQNNIFTGNTANSNYNGVRLSYSNNNQIINNIITNSNNMGIAISYSSSNNILTNNNIWDCKGIYGCLYISQSQNNTITGGVIDSSSSNLIYIESTSNNNIFKDITLLNAAKNDIYLTYSSVNNTFINCSYDKSKEYVGTSPTSSSLIRKWYYKAYVNDVNGNAVGGADISAVNKTGSVEFIGLITNSGGETDIVSITDYVNNGGAKTYYSNYTISAGNAYSSLSHTYNASLGNNLNDAFILPASSGPVEENPADIVLYSGWNLIALDMENTDVGTDRNISIIGNENGAWNLIGYSSDKSLPLENATFTDSSSNRLTWNDAVDAGKIKGYIAYYDSNGALADAKKYKYISSSELGMPETNLKNKLGYWVFSYESGKLTLPGVGGTLAGQSYNWGDLRFSDGTSELNIIQASDSTNGWINSTMQYWNNNQFKKICNDPFAGCLKSDISSWEGVFVYSNKDNIVLIRNN